MTLNVTNLIGFGGRLESPASVSYRGHDESTSALTTYTFSSKSLGTATSNRRIVVACSWREGALSNVGLSSITVGGVTCTVPGGTRIETSTVGIAMGIATVPSGTTGSIVVTFDKQAGRVGVGWWSLYDVQSTTPVGTVENSDTGSSLALGSLSTDNNGVALFAATGANGTRTFSWTNPTERWDAIIDNGLGFTHSGGDMETDGSAV
jgi:hypothetical protein